MEHQERIKITSNGLLPYLIYLGHHIEHSNWTLLPLGLYIYIYNIYIYNTINNHLIKVNKEGSTKISNNNKGY